MEVAGRGRMLLQWRVFKANSCWAVVRTRQEASRSGLSGVPGAGFAAPVAAGWTWAIARGRSVDLQVKHGEDKALLTWK